MLNEQELNRFIELFSKFTKIPKRDLTNFLQNNDISNLLKRPQSFTVEPNKLQKISDLNELRQLMKIGLDINKAKISGPDSIYNHLIKYADLTDKEYFLATFLDTKNQIIKTEEINIGTQNASLVNVKDIAKKAIMCDSANVIVSHNHPSGEPRPSLEDINITKKIHSALRLVDVNLLDHIILGDNRYISLKEQRYMDNMKSLQDILSEDKGLYKTEKISLTMKEKIVNLYNNEFPPIKHISEETAKTIDILNKNQNHPLSIKDIKQTYKEIGKRLEINHNKEDLNEFKLLQDIVDDFKKAQLKEKQIKAQSKVIEKQELVKVNVIEIS